MEQRAERLRLDEQIGTERAFAEVENYGIPEAPEIIDPRPATHTRQLEDDNTEPQPHHDLNPLAVEFSHRPEVRQLSPVDLHEILNKQNELTEVLVEQHQQNLLPSLQIAKFTGDPFEFSTFMISSNPKFNQD